MRFFEHSKIRNLFKSVSFTGPPSDFVQKRAMKILKFLLPTVFSKERPVFGPELRPNIPIGYHFSWADGIVILDTTNFDQIYESETTWLVLFYTRWCEHCATFSETYKKLAFEKG